MDDALLIIVTQISLYGPSRTMKIFLNIWSPLNLDSNHASALFKYALDAHNFQEDNSVSKRAVCSSQH